MDRPYVDYNYYTSEYSGNKIPEDEFIAFARKASLKMDAFTFGRLARWDRPCYPDSVFDACCAVAEAMYEYDAQQKAISEATSGGAVRSESNDGYSISFASTDRTADAKSQDRDIRDAIESYLGHSGLLFRGVSRKWDSGKQP